MVILAFEIYEHNPELREIKTEVSQDYHVEEETIQSVEGWDIIPRTRQHSK